MCKHLEADKPGLLAKLEKKWEKANTKEIQGKRSALYWPNYKTLYYSQNQPANSEKIFAKELKKKEEGRKNTCELAFQIGNWWEIKNNRHPSSALWVSKNMT